MSTINVGRQIKGSWGDEENYRTENSEKFFGEMRGEGSANKGNADLE